MDKTEVELIRKNKFTKEFQNHRSLVLEQKKKLFTIILSQQINLQALKYCNTKTPINYSLLFNLHISGILAKEIFESGKLISKTVKYRSENLKNLGFQVSPFLITDYGCEYFMESENVGCVTLLDEYFIN